MIGKQVMLPLAPPHTHTRTALPLGKEMFLTLKSPGSARMERLFLSGEVPSNWLPLFLSTEPLPYVRGKMGEAQSHIGCK